MAQDGTYANRARTRVNIEILLKIIGKQVAACPFIMRYWLKGDEHGPWLGVVFY